MTKLTNNNRTNHARVSCSALDGVDVPPSTWASNLQICEKGSSEHIFS